VETTGPPGQLAPPGATVEAPPRFRAPRAGELTPGWQAATVIGWVAVVVALAAVWGTSRQLGLSTWWLGPVADPRPLFVSLLPFVPPLAVIAAAATRQRHVPWLGLGAAALLAVIAAADLGRAPGLAVLQLVIAACGALVAVAGTAGTYRSAPAPTRAGDPDR
jgi:hypothetical protein